MEPIVDAFGFGKLKTNSENKVIFTTMNVESRKILFFFSHPAQYLFARPIIAILRNNGHKVFLVAKTKDVLTILLDADNEEYFNILPEGRKSSKTAILWALIKRDLRLLRLTLKLKPSILVGSDSSIAHVAFVLRKHSITVLEDDFVIIKNLAKLTYPFSSCILTPEVCDVGKWQKKKSGYRGYMKLSYLHPSVFNYHPTKVECKQPFVMIRLANLNAHHDFGIKGLTAEIVKQLIVLIKSSGREIIISTENAINDNELSAYVKKINPSDIHHYMKAADLLISDSQSMSVEASMLGTPSIRFSGFAGRISVLDELENIYGLTYGIPVSKSALLLKKVEELLIADSINADFEQKRNKMLADKINVAPYISWFIENFPASFSKIKANPDFQNSFK